MQNKYLFFWLALGLILLSGCDIANKMNPAQMMKQGKMEIASELQSASKPASINAAASPVIEQVSGNKMSNDMADNINKQPLVNKIIYTVALQIEAKDVTKAMEALNNIAVKNGGYIGSSSVKKAENRSRYGNAAIRIPAAKLDIATAQIKKLGEVDDEDKSASDITRDYYDLNSRLRNEFNFEKRLLNLLNTKTNNVNSILAVERELARVRGDIEQMQGTLRYYNNMVDLSTINVSLYEKGIDLPQKANWLQAILDIFVAALTAFFTSIGSIIVVVFSFAPWLFFFFLIVYLIGLFYRKLWGKKKEA